MTKLNQEQLKRSLDKYLELFESVTRGKASKGQHELFNTIEADLYETFGSYRSMIEQVKKYKESKAPLPNNEEESESKR